MSSTCIDEITSWNDLNIKENLLRGIFSYGFENPSPIQKRAIKPIIEKNDVIAQAQSGTGKTGAFTISTIEVVDETVQETQALIMAPTRELAIQIIGVLDKMSTFIDGFKTKLLIGGTPMDKDIVDIEKNPQVIVGTPGRVHDMLRRKKINTKFIKLLVLDEADEMLSAGFKEQIYNIFHFLKNDIQVCLFSATLPVEIQTITEKFMRSPVKILVKTESITLEGIKQYYIALEDDSQKYETIKDIFESISLSQCIIYCNSIKRVNDLNEALIKDGFPVCCIHSGMEKDERTKSYKDFSSGGSRVLISSNLTARGIDVQQVSTVINFDVPKDIHTYIHRIGRSGRWGRKGMGINFITRRDIRLIRDIEQYYDTQIEEMPAQISGA
jgi:translation initiation factor 4A|tara:strand:- start:2877 stop:4028 length:1152 start_codon:yes stop_codon:yes gene_type:complete